MSDETFGLVWFCVWISSFALDIAVLALFRKDRIGRMAGFYALKPAILVLIQSIILTYVHELIYKYSYLRVSGWTNVFTKEEGLITIPSEIIFTLVMVYLFRELYESKNRIAWLLLILDTLRWSVLVIIEGFGNPSYSDSYNASKLLMYFYFQPIIALYLGIARRKERTSNITYSR